MTKLIVLRSLELLRPANKQVIYQSPPVKVFVNRNTILLFCGRAKFPLDFY